MYEMYESLFAGADCNVMGKARPSQSLLVACGQFV